MDIQIVNKSGLELPHHATPLSAGVDLRSAESFELMPMERRIVKTGLSISLPEGYEAQVRPRSGLTIKQGLTVLNAPGTIDADYRGEIGVVLINLSNEVQTVERGDRVAQMVIAKHERVNFIPVVKLDETKRGTGGFGSTGIK